MSTTTDPTTAETGTGKNTSGKSSPGKDLALSHSSDERGSTSIADTVVAKIAGIAAREIDGVHDLGGATERVVGKVRDVLPGTTVNTTQGISVEVGERQAAVDVSIVAEYGVAIHRLAAAIRSHVIDAIESMTGLEVTEVNVTVHDVHFADDDTDTPDSPRVQ
ncbi:Asp23/Gls24 family envelope stress response protein [Gordonia sp. NB41Y]|uniref:Asp23/Gls24 family envelope stress response protein n=1 Tax=Gordonia sp. NB41Y TaxID=875808 RepID=UPI0002BE8FA6|nr:Asp23/Gls24 family envelope stress response protein [Gordonia sp. NB41Y]EMP14255.1 alkaline shock protein 23 [Gordonia sp. NB41Y]WLP92642.1 Asp23/Gls24 family envelope stress response protein [Gordonia sp. NB41Y]